MHYTSSIILFKHTPSIQNYVHNFDFFIAILNVKDLTNSSLYHLIKSKIWNIHMYTCNVRKSICDLHSQVTKFKKSSTIAFKLLKPQYSPKPQTTGLIQTSRPRSTRGNQTWRVNRLPLLLPIIAKIECFGHKF